MLEKIYTEAERNHLNTVNDSAISLSDCMTLHHIFLGSLTLRASCYAEYDSYVHCLDHMFMHIYY